MKKCLSSSRRQRPRDFSSLTNSSLKTEPFTRVTSKMVSDTDQEPKFGQTEPSTRESGETTKLTERENSGTQTETCMMVTGKMIRPTDMEPIFTSTEPNTLEPGRTIFKTDKELRAGLMGPSMTEDTRKE